MLMWLALVGVADAGGGPANVLVLHNADDPDAVDVAVYYEAARSLPPGHLCGVSGIDPLATAISFADFDTLVRGPLDACLAALPQPEEIDYLVIVRGLPYRVDIPDGYSTSLEAMLQVGHTTRQADGAELAGQAQEYSGSYFAASVKNPAWIPGSPRTGDYTVTNPYSGWYVSAPGITRNEDQPWSFRREEDWVASGWDFSGELFIVGRLDAFDYQDAFDLVDRSVASDGTFPTAPITCMKGADDARGARDPECEYVVRMLQGAGFEAEWIPAFDGALSGKTVGSFFTGAADVRGAIDGNTYVPGALFGNVTSYGAAPSNFFCNDDGSVCPASESQTSIARFVRAGATGAHGTVNEPLNNVFPNAGALLLYTFGYNAGESWFMSQQFLYWQNIYLGDPLATPYAERPIVTVEATDVPTNEPLVITATHPDGIDEIRLYVDGVRVATAEADRLEHVIGGEVDEVHEILAVAVAENAPVTRTGWPVEDQNPRPDVQGWSTAVVTVVAPIEDTDDTDDTGADEPPGGCGCATPGTGGSWIAGLALLAIRRRRAG